MLGAGARTRRHVPTTSVAAEGYLRVPGRGEHAGATVRTKARGANDGAGLARCKRTATAHGTATQRQLKAAAAPAKRSDAKRQKRKKAKGKNRSDHATGSGNRDAIRNSTARRRPPDWPWPPAAPAGAAPSRCSCAAETADLQPKQTLSSPAIPRCHPPKPPPKGPPRPRWCSRPRHPPITAAGRAGSPRPHRGFPGLDIRVPSPRFCELATTKGTLRNDRKGQKPERACLPLLLHPGEEPRPAGTAYLLVASSPLPCCALFLFQPFCTTCSQHSMRVESDCRRRLNATPPNANALRCARCRPITTQQPSPRLTLNGRPDWHLLLRRGGNMNVNAATP